MILFSHDVGGGRNCRLQDIQVSVCSLTSRNAAKAFRQDRNAAKAFRPDRSGRSSDATRRGCWLRPAPADPGHPFPGGHRGRVTPVPIPNTEVKPATADGTACVGVWESRSLPGVFFEKERQPLGTPSRRSENDAFQDIARRARHGGLFRVRDLRAGPAGRTADPRAPDRAPAPRRAATGRRCRRPRPRRA